MNAFRRLKKEIALSRPPEDDLSRLSYGELWAGVPPPEFVRSCGGARCTNGTCPQCSTSADEQRAALKRCGDRYKREECCVLCEKSGSVQVTVRDGETIHGRRTVAISLVGSPRACQFCRAEMEAATGWRDPGRCTGFGEADCPYKAGRAGRDALCYRCVPPEQQSVQVVVPPGVNPGQRMRVRVSSQVAGRH